MKTSSKIIVASAGVAAAAAILFYVFSRKKRKDGRGHYRRGAAGQSMIRSAMHHSKQTPVAQTNE
jgi:hypothetical protein